MEPVDYYIDQVYGTPQQYVQCPYIFPAFVDSLTWDPQDELDLPYLSTEDLPEDPSDLPDPWESGRWGTYTRSLLHAHKKIKVAFGNHSKPLIFRELDKPNAYATYRLGRGESFIFNDLSYVRSDVYFSERDAPVPSSSHTTQFYSYGKDFPIEDLQLPTPEQKKTLLIYDAYPNYLCFLTDGTGVEQ